MLVGPTGRLTPLAVGQRPAPHARPPALLGQRVAQRVASMGMRPRTLSREVSRRALWSPGADEGPASGTRGETSPLLPQPWWNAFTDVLYPWDCRYKAWGTLVTVAAGASAFFLPWEVAFVDPATIYDTHSPTFWMDVGLVALFAADMAVNFRAAYYEGDTLVEDPQRVAQHNLQTTFALDLIGCLPLDWLVLLSAGGAGHLDGGALMALPVLRLLHLVRLYRVHRLVQTLLYDLNISLLTITIVRNLVIVLMITQWAACGYFWEARATGFEAAVLGGLDPAFFSSLPPWDQYVCSLNWALTTLSTVEANSVPASMAEMLAQTVRAAIFLAFNITLGSYILGTITLLVVKSDERTGKYRDQSANLRQYSAVNGIPRELKDSMQEHLRLHFDTSEASDEQVLSVFPSTIRRRILQYLYMRYLRRSYLFQNVPQRFLDSLLASARVELFMPGVDIVSSGDAVNELFILVSGTLEAVSPRPSSGPAARPDGAAAGAGEEAQGGSGWVGSSGDSWDADGEFARDILGRHASRLLSADLASGSTRVVAAEGDVLGEAAFFTEVPQLESIRSASVCRLLVVSRGAYAGLERSHPGAARQVLQNLMSQAERAATDEFHGRLKTQDLDAAWVQFSRLHYTWASTELSDHTPLASRSLPDYDSGDEGLDVTTWSTRQQQVAGNLLRIRSLVRAYVERQEAERTTEFLYAATIGSEVKVRQMLEQGCPVDCADYDDRRALELAAAKGHAGLVRLLLAAGADPSAPDALGSCPLMEAAKAGQDELIDLLVAAGGRLTSSRVQVAALLCTAVFEGDLPALKRLLRAGADVDAGDYDRRTALHISAAEGNLQAVRLLVEVGGASVAVRDRWGATPLDEARRVGAAPVVRYLAPLAADAGVATLAGVVEARASIDASASWDD